jgi:hypothetical protein
MEKKERRMEEEAQRGGKSKGKRTFGGGGWGRDFVALFNQWAAKVHKEISLCSGDQKEETLLRNVPG